jgi:5-methylcytosine-specific restriction endonuclease McrA
VIDAATRRQVRERAQHRCEYCRLPQSSAPFLTFHVEHIQASQHADDDSIDNLCLACPHCNLHKGPNLTTLDLETREVTPLFHPRRQSWEEHFRFESARIEGRTVIGTATARLLKMNADEQVKIRAALMLRGEF